MEQKSALNCAVIENGCGRSPLVEVDPLNGVEQAEEPSLPQFFLDLHPVLKNRRIFVNEHMQVSESPR